MLSEEDSVAGISQTQFGSLSKTLRVLQDWMRRSELTDIAISATTRTHNFVHFCLIFLCPLHFVLELLPWEQSIIIFPGHCHTYNSQVHW